MGWTRGECMNATYNVYQFPEVYILSGLPTDDRKLSILADLSIEAKKSR